MTINNKIFQANLNLRGYLNNFTLENPQNSSIERVDSMQLSNKIENFVIWKSSRVKIDNYRDLEENISIVVLDISRSNVFKHITNFFLQDYSKWLIEFFIPYGYQYVCIITHCELVVLEVKNSSELCDITPLKYITSINSQYKNMSFSINLKNK